MVKFAFISRHKPTQEQLDLARDFGIELVEVGDLDAFAVHTGSTLQVELTNYFGGPELLDRDYFSGVVVVHPAAALRLIEYFNIAIFENENRAPEGAPPQFKPVALHIWARGESGEQMLVNKLGDPRVMGG